MTEGVAAQAPRRLLLLLNDCKTDVPPFEQSRYSFQGRSLRTLLVDLATALLPGWDICAPEPSKSAAEMQSSLSHGRYSFAIVDFFYLPTKPDKRKVTDDAIQVLRHIKDASDKIEKSDNKDATVNSRRCRCILTATLPEPNIDPHKEPKKSAIDAFVPLAHANANPWDEFLVLIKDEESRAVFHLTDNEAAQASWFAGGFFAHPTKPSALVQSNIVIADREHSRSARIQVESKGITWEEHDFSETIVVKNADVRHLRIRQCRFRAPVLFYNCTFLRHSFIYESTFDCHLNFVACTFESDLLVERSTFQEGADAKRAAERSLARLPWFDRVTFEKSFVFRNNVGPKPWHRTLEGEQKVVVPQVLQFHACTFAGRVDITVPTQKTNLTFYGSSFRSGQDVDISYSYIPAESLKDPDEDYIPPSLDEKDRLDKWHGRFQLGGATRDVLELRFACCDIAARVVVRENPWGSDPALEKNTSTYTPRYKTEDGLGLNLYGATLSGSLNVRFVRLKWINAERLTVLGGAMLANLGALTFFESTNTPWFERLQRSLLTSADLVRIVFAERWAKGDEAPRFSAAISHSSRLVELSHKKLRELAVLQGIVQQHEELRKAFRNASNSHDHEDFCQYKALTYAGKIRRMQAETVANEWWEMVKARREEVKAWWGKKWKERPVTITLAAAVIAPIVIACVSWVISFWWKLPYGTSSTPLAFMIYATFGIICLASTFMRDLRRAVHGFAETYFLRFCLGYLIYPVRPLFTSFALIGIFACGYIVVSILAPSLGSLEGSESEGLIYRGTWLAIVVRSFHFSIVTFTTLGYGDVGPHGILRPIANFEAMIGALFIALITVSMARAVIRG